MNLLLVSVLKGLSAVRGRLNDDRWLVFSQLCQLQRYELNRLIEGAMKVTPATLIRVGAALEEVGQKTRLSELDRATNCVLTDFGLTQRGEIKDYFPNEWDRTHITKYVCESVTLSAMMVDRVENLAARIRTGENISGKEKVDLTEIAHLQLELGLIPPVQTSVPAVIASAPSSEVRAPTGQLQSRNERFKALTLNLLDFARVYTDPSVTEEVRDELRKVVGQRNIFDLKNLLARLCGSTAYKL